MSRLVVALLAIVALVTGCAGTKGGAQIDDWCVAGRLTSESAEWFNSQPEGWKRHSDYTAPIRKKDRIVSRHCSEALIALGAGDLAAAFEAFQRAQRNDDGGQ